MPLSIPTRKGVVTGLANYVRGQLPTLDPTTNRRSFAGGLVKALGLGLYDWYLTLKRYADREPFPQTATGQFLRNGWWRDITKLDPNPPAPARGVVVLTGTAYAVIPAGTEFQLGGVRYEVESSVTIMAQSRLAASLAYSAGLCVFETTEDHFLATGMSVVISGATPAAFNGTFTITVTADNEFTYVPASVPSPTTASGSSIGAAATYTNATLEATSTGQTTNVDAGGTLGIVGALTGVASTALVTWGGLAGGTEAESEEEYRARILEALGADYGTFTDDEIAIVAKQVPGVTKVWVRKAMIDPPAGWPLEGRVRISFLRGNDAQPIPSAQEVQDVKDRIVGLIMPAHTADEDVEVFAPTARPVNFTFSAISPDTTSMRLAIEYRLRQFMAEQVDLGADIGEDEYRCAIRETFDLERRVALASFTLSNPTGTVDIGPDEIPTLGTVIFP